MARIRWPNQFRFSLRTLFVLVTIAAFALGWFGYYWNWARERHEYLRNYTLSDLWMGDIRHTYFDAPPLPWGLHLLGERPQRCLIASETNADGKKRLQELFPEATIQWLVFQPMDPKFQLPSVLQDTP